MRWSEACSRRSSTTVDKRSFTLNRKSVITVRMCRAITAVIIAAGSLLLTGCVNAANDWSTQASQSIADGLGSAISSLVEAALLSIIL